MKAGRYLHQDQKVTWGLHNGILEWGDGGNAVRKEQGYGFPQKLTGGNQNAFISSYHCIPSPWLAPPIAQQHPPTETSCSRWVSAAWPVQNPPILFDSCQQQSSQTETNTSTTKHTIHSNGPISFLFRPFSKLYSLFPIFLENRVRRSSAFSSRARQTSQYKERHVIAN